MSQVSPSHHGREELFVFIGAALGTAVALLAAQIFYGSVIDQRYHAQLKAAGPYQEIAAKKDAERQIIASGKLPLARAKELIAQKGRGGIGSIGPVASDDLSPITGWIHRPGFKPVVAHPIRAARAVPVPSELGAAPVAPGAPAAGGTP